VLEYKKRDYSVFASVAFSSDTKIYYTHDNGGRPFKVVLTGNQCEVWKGIWDETTKSSVYDKKLVSKRLDRFWNGFDAFAGWLGSAVLMQANQEYIYAER